MRLKTGAPRRSTSGCGRCFRIADALGLELPDTGGFKIAVGMLLKRGYL